MDMQKNREEIDSRYKWRLEDLFETDELWLQTAQAAEEKIEEIRKYSGKFTKNAASMAECIGKLYELNGLVTKLYVYAYMRIRIVWLQARSIHTAFRCIPPWTPHSS